jgi:hypothetical protein
VSRWDLSFVPALFDGHDYLDKTRTSLFLTSDGRRGFDPRAATAL